MSEEPKAFFVNYDPELADCCYQTAKLMVKDKMLNKYFQCDRCNRAMIYQSHWAMSRIFYEKGEEDHV